MNARYEVTVSNAKSIVYTFTDLAQAYRFAENCKKNAPAKPVEIRNEFGTMLWKA